MAEDVKGQVGQSGVSYDVQVDNDLNIVLSIGYKIPLASLLDAAAAKSSSPAVKSVEGWLIALLKQYEASKA